MLNYWSGGSVDLTRGAGRYTFKEVFCVVGPYIGLHCIPQDTHVVVVGSDSAKAVKPDSLADQATYKFTARSGDFNSDGRMDVLIDRTTSGSVDGSMRSYILYQRAGGAVEAAKPTDAELKRARGFQTTSKLNLIPNDLNIDGFADHTIENLKSVMGSAVADGHVVFAPGTARDKTRPSGDVAVTHEFTSFYADLAKWLNDPAHFDKNISTTRIPVYGLGWACTCSALAMTASLAGTTLISQRMRMSCMLSLCAMGMSLCGLAKRSWKSLRKTRTSTTIMWKAISALSLMKRRHGAVIAGRRVCVPKEGGNPVKTAVGTEGKLPEHAIANTTLEGHIFHDPNNPKECPKKLNDGDWKQARLMAVLKFIESPTCRTAR